MERIAKDCIYQVLAKKEMKEIGKYLGKSFFLSPHQSSGNKSSEGIRRGWREKGPFSHHGKYVTSRPLRFSHGRSMGLSSSRHPQSPPPSGNDGISPFLLLLLLLPFHLQEKGLQGARGRVHGEKGKRRGMKWGPSLPVGINSPNMSYADANGSICHWLRGFRGDLGPCLI